MSRSAKLKHWIIVNGYWANERWMAWTGKKAMRGWCCGDCLSHPINWTYETKEAK